MTYEEAIEILKDGVFCASEKQLKAISSAPYAGCNLSAKAWEEVFSAWWAKMRKRQPEAVKLVETEALMSPYDPAETEIQGLTLKSFCKQICEAAREQDIIRLTDSIPPEITAENLKDCRAFACETERGRMWSDTFQMHIGGKELAVSEEGRVPAEAFNRVFSSFDECETPMSIVALGLLPGFPVAVLSDRFGRSFPVNANRLQLIAKCFPKQKLEFFGNEDALAYNRMSVRKVVVKSAGKLVACTQGLSRENESTRILQNVEQALKKRSEKNNEKAEADRV